MKLFLSLIMTSTISLSFASQQQEGILPGSEGKQQDQAEKVEALQEKGVNDGGDIGMGVPEVTSWDDHDADGEGDDVDKSLASVDKKPKLRGDGRTTVRKESTEPRASFGPDVLSEGDATESELGSRQQSSNALRSQGSGKESKLERDGEFSEHIQGYVQETPGHANGWGAETEDDKH